MMIFICRYMNLCDVHPLSTLVVSATKGYLEVIANHVDPYISLRTMRSKKRKEKERNKRKEKKRKEKKRKEKKRKAKQSKETYEKLLRTISWDTTKRIQWVIHYTVITLIV